MPPSILALASYFKGNRFLEAAKQQGCTVFLLTVESALAEPWARLDPVLIPTDLNDEVRAYAASVPPGTRIFNDANLGGYLIYHAPSLKIFMDDRCELYGDDWIRDYATTLALPPDEIGPRFERWAADYGFDRALVMTEPAEGEKPPLERYLLGSPQKWREVARGKRAVMFERIK